MQTFVVRVSSGLVVLGMSMTMSARAQSDRIAFSSTKDGEYEIYSRREDGSGERRLTHLDLPDQRPSICPDGQEYVFDKYPHQEWSDDGSTHFGSPDWGPGVLPP
jgi:Tol biopolymer transport system component